MSGGPGQFLTDLNGVFICNHNYRRIETRLEVSGSGGTVGDVGVVHGVTATAVWDVQGTSGVQVSDL